jgi:hypothetical protein
MLFTTVHNMLLVNIETIFQKPFAEVSNWYACGICFRWGRILGFGGRWQPDESLDAITPQRILGERPGF